MIVKRKHLLWVGVLLMLIAMVVYIITLDESEPLSLPGADEAAGEVSE